jgi:hypothetical protein
MNTNPALSPVQFSGIPVEHAPAPPPGRSPHTDAPYLRPAYPAPRSVQPLHPR